MQSWPSGDEGSGTRGDAQVDAVPVQHPHMSCLVEWSMIWKQAKAPTKEGMRGISDLDLD